MAVLDWPVIGQQPVDEFNTPGCIVQTFQPQCTNGKAHFLNPREHTISANKYLNTC